MFRPNMVFPSKILIEFSGLKWGIQLAVVVCVWLACQREREKKKMKNKLSEAIHNLSEIN